MLLQPLERGRAKTAKKSAARPERVHDTQRGDARRGPRPSLDLAAKPFNTTQRKGATK
jgi:hypothetical protein